VVYSGISVGEIYEKRDRYRDERRKRTIRNGVPAIEGVQEIVREREQRRVDTRTARVTEREGPPKGACCAGVHRSPVAWGSGGGLAPSRNRREAPRFPASSSSRNGG